MVCCSYNGEQDCINGAKFMLLRVIDRLLDRSFMREPDYTRLSCLESDVWRQIKQSKAVNSSKLFILPVWSNTQLRYACLALALIGGMFISQASIKSSSQADILGLEVFSPNASFLITSNFIQQKPVSL